MRTKTNQNSKNKIIMKNIKETQYNLIICTMAIISVILAIVDMTSGLSNALITLLD